MAEQSATVPVLSSVSGRLAGMFTGGKAGTAPTGSQTASVPTVGGQAVPSSPDGNQYQTLAGGSVTTPATPQMNMTASVQPVQPQSANPLPTPPTTTPIARPTFDPSIDKGLQSIGKQAVQAGKIGPLPTYTPGLDFTMDPALEAVRAQMMSGVTNALGGGLSLGDQIQGKYESLMTPVQQEYQQREQDLINKTALMGRRGLEDVNTEFGTLEMMREQAERNIAADLAWQAAQADQQAMLQALGLGGQFLSAEQQAMLQRQMAEEQAAQAAAEIALQGLGLQSSAQLQGLGIGADVAGQRANFGVQQAGLGLEADRAIADEAYRRTALQQEGALTREGYQNQAAIAGMQAQAQIAAAQAAQTAAMYGADKNAQTQAARLAFDQYMGEAQNLLAVQGMENQMAQFGANLDFQNQQFQYGMSRDAVGDLFNSLDMLGRYGYLGSPDQNMAQQGVQNAYGQGVSNYGADAAQSGASASSAFQSLGMLPFVYQALQPQGGPVIPAAPADLPLPPLSLIQ